MSSSQLYTINGVKVIFPCKAYPSQLSMMDKIIKGIDRQQNCLLESPTGSGKSLALLCSALAWQTTECEKMREEEGKSASCCCCCHGNVDSGLPLTSAANGATDAGGWKQPEDPPPPPVAEKTNVITINGSDSEDDFQENRKKTHANKKQAGNTSVVEVENSAKWTMELVDTVNASRATVVCSCSCEKTGKTKHRLPKIYFGTRTHKQVAQIIRELRKTAYKSRRMTILSSREHTCINPQVMKSSNRNEECKRLLDDNCCRYFDRVKRVYVPSCLDVGGDLDTAWDIEDLLMFARRKKACSYFGARQLREMADIVFCPYNYLIDPTIRKSMDIVLSGQIVLLDEAHNIEDSSREAASYAVMQDQLIEAATDLLHVANQGQKPNEHRALAQMCSDLSQTIDGQKMQLENGGYDGGSKVWTGTEIVAQMEMAGITAVRLKELEGFFVTVSEKEEENGKDTVKFKMAAATNAVLDGLFMVLGFIYKESFKFIDDYRVAILKIYTYKSVPTNNRWLGKRCGNVRATWSYQLNFWCMNPAVAFTDMSLSARCVILSSGTLSPMTSFQSELGVVFPIQLEANHVIGNSQVWIASISRGPSNQPLLGSYQNAETLSYQDEIGQIVLQICEKVPFGVLCFLPSYKSMEKLMNRWQEVGILARISRFKVILREPRAADKENFDNILREFYEAIRNGNPTGESVRTPSGALLFAVCRGKVSEGLDFTDDNARAVITVGIPYPNIKDTQVIQKKRYNDERSHKGLLCGSEWYDIQAYRALNQALGRCIRHRHDWGALVLLDERFCRNPQKYTSGLSKWIRQRMQYYSDFQNAMSGLTEFTTQRTSNSTLDLSSFVSSQSLDTTLIPKQQLHESPEKPLAIRLLSDRNDSVVETSDHHSRQSLLMLQRGVMDGSRSMSTFKNGPSSEQTRPTTDCVSRYFNSQAGGFLPASQFLSALVDSDAEKESLDLSCSPKPKDLAEESYADLARPEADVNRCLQQTNQQVLNRSVPADDRIPVSQTLELLPTNGKAVRPALNVHLTNEPKPEMEETDADDSVPALASVDVKKPDASKMINLGRCRSPDLFDSVPTEVGSEEIGAVLRELGVDGTASQNTVEPPGFFQNSIAELKSENGKKLAKKSSDQCRNDLTLTGAKSVSYVQVAMTTDCGTVDGRKDPTPSEYDYDLECSQVGQKRHDDCNSFPFRKSRQLSVKKTPLSKKRNVSECESDDQIFSALTPHHFEIKPESNKKPKTRVANDARPRTTIRLGKKKNFGDEMLNGKKTKAGKGVHFTEDSDLEKKPALNVLACYVCRAVLSLDESLPSSIIAKETSFRPSFWNKLFEESETMGHLSRSQLQESALCLMTDLPSNDRKKPLHNSYWSEADGCCIQLLFCSSCKAGKRSTRLGAEVKAVLEGQGHQLRPGQVWLVLACLKES